MIKWLMKRLFKSDGCSCGCEIGPLDVRELMSIEKTDDYTQFGPVHECLCGGNLFIMLGFFDDGEVSGYFTEGRCAGCGANVTLPTEIDQMI